MRWFTIIGFAWVIASAPAESGAAPAAKPATSASSAVAAKRAYENARRLYFRLKASPDKQKLRHHWTPVIAAFNEVTRAYPNTPEAAAALYTAAELWSDLYLVSRVSADLEEARAAYSRLVHSYPQSQLADDALYERAQIELRKGETGNSVATLNALLKAYPKGDQAPKARRLLKVHRVVAGVVSEPAPEPVPAPPVARAKFKVVLDPGHGGHDVGALGKSGAKESDVALSIANEVRQRLEARGVEVVMTRTSDVFVSLEERTAIANRSGADAFVSIHCNAHKNPAAQGVETYYLNTSDSRYALRLAARENSAQEDQVNDVQLVLADLATKVSAKDSKDLAERVQSRLMKAVTPFNTTTRDLGAKGALFYVLLGARMPAILVETSFISNAKEEKLLISQKYQGAVADAVVDGVLDTLAKPALPETTLASRK